MKQSVRLVLSAAVPLPRNADSEFRIAFGDVKTELTNFSEDIKKLLSWSISNDEIVFKARPEAFGIVRLMDTIIEVTPKFLSHEDSIPASFVSDLFNVTGSPTINRIPVADRKLSGHLSLFDWYFFSILSQVHDFLRKYDRLVLRAHDEVVLGVRGRIKIADTIRVARGLKHINVCEVQTTEPRYEFLGTIKGFISLLSRFSNNEEIKSVSNRCQGLLRDIPELPFNRTSLAQLKRQAKLLVSEHRPSGAILDSLFGVFDLIQNGVGSISHHCFSFNMNAQFENLVVRLLKVYSAQHDLRFESGNDSALNLLNNECVGLQIDRDNEDQEFEAASIKIKPDAYLSQGQRGVVVTLDAKYKILSYDPMSNCFSGIQSKDVQQVLSYWLHFYNKEKNPLGVGIIYPHPQPNEAKVVQKIGSIKLDNPIQGGKLSVDIFTVDILKAIRKLAAGEGSDLMGVEAIFPAA